MIILVLVLALLRVGHVAAVNATHSRSHSRSHSHSHSHSDSDSYSPSLSQSQGYCPPSGILSTQPNGTLYRDLSFPPCRWQISDADNTYGAQATYPCVYHGGPVLAPTEVTLQLSATERTGTNAWVDLVIAYNYSHFHALHPDGVANCYNEPTPGEHNPPFLDWMEVGSVKSGCNRVCWLWLTYRVQCGKDYMKAKSGHYYIEIPYVGRVNFNVSICVNEKVAQDYATECQVDMNTCPQDTVHPLLSAGVHSSPTFWVIGIVAAVLALLF